MYGVLRAKLAIHHTLHQLFLVAVLAPVDEEQGGREGREEQGQEDAKAKGNASQRARVGIEHAPEQDTSGNEAG